MILYSIEGFIWPWRNIKQLFKPLFLFALITVLGGFFLYLNFFVEKPTVEKFPDSIWESSFDEVNEKWTRGIDIQDNNFIKNCPQLSVSHSVTRELRSCRASLLFCYYANRVNKLSHKKNWFQMKVNFPKSDNSNYLLYSPALTSKNQALENALKIEVEVSSDTRKETKEIFLKDVCRQTELPQGFFRFGSKKNNNVWHPSRVSYHIDKYLVRNIDIAEWLSQVEVKEKVDYEQKYPFFPAVSLTSSQMRSYCAFRGGEVLSSRVLDSVTYHHGRADVKEIAKRPPGPNTSPYPFGARLVDSPHYFALKNEIQASNDSCSKIYSSECLKLNPVSSSWSLGWSGVSELLGGPLEYVQNKEMPRRNLKLSSYYFPLKSKVHQAGIRGYWNGKEYVNSKSFNFFRYSPEKTMQQYKVGFRCMNLAGGTQ